MLANSQAEVMFSALVALIDERIAAASNSTRRIYSQFDGERRPGWRREKHLRVWRRARAAGHPGALPPEGRARLLTEEACIAFGVTSAVKTKRPPNVVAIRTNEDDVAAELGLGRRRIA